MADNRKPFTAELQRAGKFKKKPDAPKSGGEGVAIDFDELKAFIEEQNQKLLDEIMQTTTKVVSESKPKEEVSGALVDDYKKEILHASELTRELKELTSAIENTKKEISQLRHPLTDEDRINIVSNELDAVVSATEQATNTIIDSAERIDNIADVIRSTLAAEGGNTNPAEEINDLVMSIFEACNFQDLTGQRITKVVDTLMFIEERVEKMIEIWGTQDFSVFPTPAPMGRPDDTTTLTGPIDDNHEHKISQDDIDALFD